MDQVIQSLNGFSIRCQLAQLGALVEALAITYEIEESDDPAKAFAEFIRRLARHRCEGLTRLWEELHYGTNLLHVLARRPTKALLADLSALCPNIVRLGGKATIIETFRAIQGVGRW